MVSRRWRVIRGIVAAVLLISLLAVLHVQAGPGWTGSEWNLAAEFRVGSQAANPNPDNFGNANVWYFMESQTLARDPTTYGLLPEFITDVFWIPGLQTWQDTFACGDPCKTGTPAVSINATGSHQSPYGIWWPAGVVKLHPTPYQLAIVGWRSPIDGTVAVAGAVNHLHSCGDGISWFVDHFDGSTNTNFASGSIQVGESQEFRDGVGGASLASVTVSQGDFLYFLVDPNAGYSCDSTGLSVIIRQIATANVAPTVDAGPDATINEGGTFASSGSFTDPDPDTWTATVDYGDGSGVQTLDLDDKSFTLNHVYADDGTYTVLVTVDDGQGGVGTDTAAVTVLTPWPCKVDTFTQPDGPALGWTPADGNWANWAVENGEYSGSVDTNGMAYTFLTESDGWSDYRVQVSVYPIGPDERQGWRAALMVRATPDPSSNGYYFYQIHTYRDGLRITKEDPYGAAMDFYRTDFPVPANAWHTIGVEVKGNQLKLNYNGAVVTPYPWIPQTPDGAVIDEGLGGYPPYLSGAIGLRVWGHVATPHVHFDNVEVCRVSTNTPPEVNAGPDATINEGGTFASSGSFSDPDADTWTATVDYGDGSGVQELDIDDKSFALNHVYADNGTYTALVTVDDGQGGVGTDTAAATALNVAPTIVLSGNATVDEGSEYALTLGPVTDPGADTVIQYVVHWGDGQTDAYDCQGDMYHTYVDGDAGQTITLDLVDEDGTHVGAGTLPLTVLNAAPTVGPIQAPVVPVQIGTEIVATVAFADPGILDTHTALWQWGDGSSSAGSVDETAGSGSVEGRHTYAVPGIYASFVTVTDKDGDSGTAQFRYVVVYNPEGGFVTGGGWINSPAGAYTPNPALTGKANFGFEVKYQKGATIPTGNTEFQFKVANLNFHSESYDWLVIAGARAQYKGTGTINGTGNYGFMLTAIDAALTPSTDVDLFRIKIWEKTTNTLIYDNQLGAADDAEPSTAIGGGSIVIHKAK